MDTSLTNKGAVSKSRRARPAAPIYLPPALRKEQQNANDSDTIQHVAQTNNKNTVKPKVQSEVISSQNNSLILERFKNEMESMKEQSTSVNSNQHNDLILGRLSSEDQILNEKSDNGKNQNRKPKYIPCSNCFLSYKYDKSGTEKLPYSKNICNICKDELKNKPKPVIHDSNKNYSQQLNEGKLEISNLTAKHCSHSYNKSEEPFKISNDIPNVTNENNSKVRNTSDSLSEYCSKNKQILDLLLANCTNVASIPDILIKNSPAGTNLMDWLLDNYPDVNLSNYPDLISELFIGAESILRDFANLKIEVPKMAPEIKSTLSKDSSKLVADHVAELRTIPDMFKSNISNLTLENNEKAINNTNSSAEISLKINIFEDISKITTVNITDNKFNLDNENDAKTTRSLNRAVDDLEISKISNVSVEPCSQSTLSCNNFQMDDSTKEIKSKTCKESTNSEVKELETRYQTQIGVHAEQEQTVKNVNLNVCIIDNSKKTDRKCDTDQAEMVRASEEINRRNKRIMKHLLNKSDMLIITDQNSEIGDTECKKNKTNGFDISNESDVEAAVDNWEDLLSEEKSIDNIIYKSKSKYPKKIHPTNESNIDDQPNNETLEGEGDLSHVIEIYNFPEEFQTRDLLAIFDSLKMTNYSIKWVDETHALGVFNSGYAANEVIKMKHPLIKVRPIAEASKQSKSKVKRYPNAMVPNAVRPQTCPQTARRMVTGALGIKLTNAKEERAKEIQILKDARAMKKLKAKLEDEAWEGKLIVWDSFKHETLGDYIELNLQTDVLLLADVFENFRDICLKSYTLDSAHYYTTTGIRGCITRCCNRYAKANNHYMISTPEPTRPHQAIYDLTTPEKYLIYFDACNLYGWAMTQCLPHGSFDWLTDEDINRLDFNVIPENGSDGYIFEVDLEYRQRLHDKDIDLPLCPEQKATPGLKLKELLTTLYDKKKFIIHDRYLKQALELGMTLTKGHRGIRFQQSYFMKKYIDKNTNFRKLART